MHRDFRERAEAIGRSLRGTPPEQTDQFGPEQPPNGHQRVTGAPLPVGPNGFDPQGPSSLRAVPPPGRSLSPTSASDDASAMQRAMGVFKQAMPYVQRLLPLVEGNIGAAIVSLLSQRPHNPPPAPKVDLVPIENNLAELQLQQQDLHGQMMEQNTSLKRVEDQIEMMREATERNTLEQQELVDDLKAMSNKVNLIAWLLFGMLIVSVLLNLALFVHIKQVLP